MELKLRNFTTPNFCIPEMPPGRRADGFRDISIPIKDVPAEDLDRLCTQFRAEIFAKAGKADPQEAGNG